MATDAAGRSSPCPVPHAPVLPPLTALRTEPLDDDTRKKRSNERARALLRAKFRDFQSTGGGLSAEATLSTDQYFRLRDEARAKRPPPREPMPVYSLGKVERRKKPETGVRLERYSFLSK